MEANFWHERWDKNQIGFHRSDVNPWLKRYFERTLTGKSLAEPGAHILVPLCGKSLDLLFLWQQGFRVTGVELSERACRDFFAENKLAFEVKPLGGFLRFRSDGIELWCGDFFDLTTKALPPIQAVYDRAALIALPPEMRAKYARHLTSLLAARIRTLLVTLDYDQRQMNGPPFAVSENEVQRLFSADHELALLETSDCLEDEPRFRQKGLDRLDETAWLLEKRP